MFSSRLTAFRPTHLLPSHLCPPRPPHCRPASPEPRRERSERSAFLHSFLTALNSHAPQSFPRFPIVTRLRARRKSRNFKPLMRLLHNLRTPRVGGTVPAAYPSSALSLARLTLNLEQPLIASVPYRTFRLRAVRPRRMRTYAKPARKPIRFRTYKTHDLKPFRIRTYKKMGRGCQGSGRISDLSASRVSVAHSMLRPAP
jgi:hypothetical protein